MKRKHDEIVTSFENILEYLSTDRCEIKDLDHQKLEELSCVLVKGVSLFIDLSDHIVNLNNNKIKIEDYNEKSFSTDQLLQEEKKGMFIFI